MSVDVILDPTNEQHLAAARAVLEQAGQPVDPVDASKLTFVRLQPAIQELYGLAVTTDGIDAARQFVGGTWYPGDAAHTVFNLKNTDGLVTEVGAGDIVVQLHDGPWVILADDLGRVWECDAADAPPWPTENS
ncbi:MAG: hypothetical protein ABJB03_00415 [Rhodoglobus sp.]